MIECEVTWPMQAATIQAVEMVRGIRDAHYAEVKDLSPEQKVAYLRDKARALHAELGHPELLESSPAPLHRALVGR